MTQRIVLAGASLIFALSSPGEQAPPADANAPEISSNHEVVTFSSKVNRAQVPVVVRDAQGRVVRNLKKEDFPLFDQGKLGNYISGLERVLNLRLRDQTLAGVRSSGITVKETFHVAPGRYVVRMVVRDSEGKATGSRNTGVDIQ